MFMSLHQRLLKHLEAEGMVLVPAPYEQSNQPMDQTLVACVVPEGSVMG